MPAPQTRRSNGSGRQSQAASTAPKVFTPFGLLLPCAWSSVRAPGSLVRSVVRLVVATRRKVQKKTLVASSYSNDARPVFEPPHRLQALIGTSESERTNVRWEKPGVGEKTLQQSRSCAEGKTAPKHLENRENFRTHHIIASQHCNFERFQRIRRHTL